MFSEIPQVQLFHCQLGDIGYQRRSGDGPLIVFVHGIGASKSIFKGVFSSEHFNGADLLLVDMLGHGDSRAAESVGFSMEEHAAGLEDLIRHIAGPDRHILFACHSVGGAVGVLLARNLGERVKALVSIEGNLIGSDCGLITRRTISVPLDKFLTELRPQLAKEIAAKGEDPADFLATSGDVFFATARSVVSWCDSGKLLSLFLGTLTCKRAYIYGDRNADMEILHRLGGVATVSVSGSGHCMMLDNPPEFYDNLWRVFTT